MKKRFIILIIILISLISLTSCGKVMTIKQARKQIIKALGYIPEEEHVDLNIVGKYGKGIVIDLSFGDKDSGSYYTIEDIEIPLYNSMSVINYFVDGKLYVLQDAYYLGYIVKEDVYDIRDKYLENKSDIKMDYPLVDPNPRLKRCIHEANDWEIKAATCVEVGKKTLSCKKCKKELESVDLYIESHDYVNGKCTYCKEKEYVYIDKYKETPEKMIHFLGGYQLGENEAYVWLEEDIRGVIEPRYYEKLINIDDLAFIMSSKVTIKVYYDINSSSKISTVASLEEAYNKGIINKNILIDIQKELNKKNIVGNYIYENYSYKDVTTRYPRNVYLKLGDFLQDKIDCEKTYNNLVKMSCPIYGPSVDFYGKYNEYYVGMVVDKYKHNKVEDQVEIKGYKFESLPYRKIYVFNDEKIYELKKAYKKGIISDENLAEIYEIYKFNTQ